MCVILEAKFGGDPVICFNLKTVPFLRYKRQQSGNIWRLNVEIERDWCVMFGME